MKQPEKIEPMDDREIPDKTCKHCSFWRQEIRQQMPSNFIGMWPLIFQSACLNPKVKVHYPEPDFGCIHHEFKEVKDDLLP